MLGYSCRVYGWRARRRQRWQEEARKSREGSQKKGWVEEAEEATVFHEGSLNPPACHVMRQASRTEIWQSPTRHCSHSPVEAGAGWGVLLGSEWWAHVSPAMTWGTYGRNAPGCSPRTRRSGIHSKGWCMIVQVCGNVGYHVVIPVV